MTDMVNKEFENLRERMAKALIDNLHMLGYSGAEAERLWGWRDKAAQATSELLMWEMQHPKEVEPDYYELAKAKHLDMLNIKCWLKG